MFGSVEQSPAVHGSEPFTPQRADLYTAWFEGSRLWLPEPVNPFFSRGDAEPADLALPLVRRESKDSGKDDDVKVRILVKMIPRPVTDAALWQVYGITNKAVRI